LEAAVIEIEVIGNEATITAAKAAIASLATAPVRAFEHQGASGEGGVYGILTSVAGSAIPKLIDVVKRLALSDRDLKISFNGMELVVRDINEATQVIDLLAARGLLNQRSN
jgi:hypothetical protein